MDQSGASGGGLPSVSADRARELAPGSVLLDVREHLEWDAGHAPGAVHIPLGSLVGTAVPGAEGRTVLVICRSGHRSRAATEYLRAQGLEAFNVEGGMRAWQAAGGDVVAPGGAPGHIA